MTTTGSASRLAFSATRLQPSWVWRRSDSPMLGSHPSWNEKRNKSISPDQNRGIEIPRKAMVVNT